MKIAIITYQRTCSFGAVLQMYGLQSVLNSYDSVSCKIIDFSNEAIERVYRPLRFKDVHSFRDAARLILYNKRRKQNWKVFNSFIDTQLSLTDKVDEKTVAKYGDSFDAYIAGSDQVWHTGMNGHNGFYFLNFVTDRKKKYSYAASFGRKTLPQEEIEYYIEMLSDFEHISLRERTNVEELQHYIDKPISTNPDPTLLLSPSFWQSKAHQVFRKKPYVLIYTVLSPDKLLEEAQKYAEKRNLDVIVLGLNRHLPRGAKSVSAIDPFEFLGYIMGADTVFTNSFHATVFSILFHKPFFVETNQIYISNGKSCKVFNNRIADLLANVGLSDREISISERPQIDWDRIDDSLKLMRENGLNYLGGIVK